jgi:hypothetical protein
MENSFFKNILNKEDIDLIIPEIEEPQFRQQSLLVKLALIFLQNILSSNI